MPLLRPPPPTLTRRRLLGGAAGAAASLAFPLPALAAPAAPAFTHGLQSGDVQGDRAVLWARADRDARLLVEWDTTEGFAQPRRLVGPAALEDSDFTAKLRVTGLPPDQTIFWRARWLDLRDVNRRSAPLTGRFHSAPATRRDVSFVWSADTCGQGWGINEDWGGYRLYETMRRFAPDFFVHCGDTIYADGPLVPEVPLPDGTLWRNLVTPEKAKVAETLDEFRGNHRYNLLDRNLLAFNAEVPTVALWDDHDVLDNWYPAERLEADARYGETSVALLAARANRAFLEYLPVSEHDFDRERLYRSLRYGPHLELFLLDARSHRGPNGPNDQAEAGAATAYFGTRQVNWLLQGLRKSTATWKAIVNGSPLGLLVPDGFGPGAGKDFEGAANGDGPPRGRELEIAQLLQGIRDAGIGNVVWFTGDVHYAAAHYYDPAKARFRDFAPFWEFVAGPINAGTFGPNALDDTFGPQVVFEETPPEGQFNLPPSAGMQFFGQASIDGESGSLRVVLRDLAGDALFTVTLNPER